jgi:hypothetical protein
MILLFVACAAISLAAQKKSAATAGSSALAPDKGKFTIKLDGKTVGHEEFEIAPSGGGWLAKGTSDIKPPEGSASKITGSLTMQPDGAPMSYEWTAQTDRVMSAHVLFVNGVARITIQVQGADPLHPFEQDLTFNSSLIAVLDNNLYHQYAVLARIYDWAKGGVQTFPVIIPQELTPGSITVQSTGSASSDGKTYEGLKVTSSDLQILLLLDTNHRLMRLEVPDAKVSVIRE